MKIEEVLDAVYETRLLVFLECNGESSECETQNSHHFHQVLLTPRQFKKVSDAIITKITKDPTLKEGKELIEMRLSNAIFDAKPFDGLSSTL